MIRLIILLVFLIVYFIVSLPIQLLELILERFNMNARNKSSLAFVNFGLRIVQLISGVKLEVHGYKNIPKDHDGIFSPVLPTSIPEPPIDINLTLFPSGNCAMFSVFCDNELPFCRIKRRIHAKGHPSGVFYYEFFQKRKGGRQCAL